MTDPNTRSHFMSGQEKGLELFIRDRERAREDALESKFQRFWLDRIARFRKIFGDQEPGLTAGRELIRGTWLQAYEQGRDEANQAQEENDRHPGDFVEGELT